MLFSLPGDIFSPPPFIPVFVSISVVCCLLSVACLFLDGRLVGFCTESLKRVFYAFDRDSLSRARWCPATAIRLLRPHSEASKSEEPSGRAGGWRGGGSPVMHDCSRMGIDLRMLVMPRAPTGGKQTRRMIQLLRRGGCVTMSMAVVVWP